MVAALPERALAACLNDVVRPSIVDSLDQNCVFARKTSESKLYKGAGFAIDKVQMHESGKLLLLIRKCYKQMATWVQSPDSKDQRPTASNFICIVRHTYIILHETLSM